VRGSVEQPTPSHETSEAGVMVSRRKPSETFRAFCLMKGVADDGGTGAYSLNHERTVGQKVGTLHGQANVGNLRDRLTETSDQ
jgi:hypothetical protein